METVAYSRKYRDGRTLSGQVISPLRYIVGRHFCKSASAARHLFYESRSFIFRRYLAKPRPRSAMNVLAHIRPLLRTCLLGKRRCLPTPSSAGHLVQSDEVRCCRRACFLGSALAPPLHRHAAFCSLLSVLLSLVACNSGPSKPKDVGDTVWQLAGVVTDSTTGMPLPNVSVCPVNWASGDVTDEAGRYYLLLGWECCYSIEYAKERYGGCAILS